MVPKNTFNKLVVEKTSAPDNFSKADSKKKLEYRLTIPINIP